MVKFTDLGLKEVNYTDKDNQKQKLTVIPVITLNENAFAKTKGNEKKEERIWKQFKNVCQNKIEHAEELTINHDDENEPFRKLEDSQYYFTNLLSLTSLKENQRKDLNIGLRYLTEDKDGTIQVHVFSDEFISYLDEDNVSENISFDALETTYENVVTALRNESKKNVSEIEERERVKKEQEEAEARESERDRQVDAPESSEDTPYQEETDVSDEYQDDETSQDVYDEDDEVAYEEPRTDIDELKDELFVAIDNLIPRTHLDEVNIDYDETQYDTNARYSELETIALNAIAKYQNDKIALLETKREDVVNRIYQDAVNELWKQYLQNNKLLNYESDESEYHTEFKRIQDSYNRVINDAETQRQNEFNRQTKLFNERVEREAKQAYEETKARLEREERHLVEEDSYAYKDDLINNANDEYEQQLATLESDIQNVYETRKYEIVDKVVNGKQPEIKQHANTVESERKLTADEINDKHQKEMQKLKETIESFELEQLKQKQDFENKVSVEVDKITSDTQKENAELKHQLELLQEQQKATQARIKDNEETIKNHEIERRNDKTRIEMAEKEAKHYREKYENQIQSTFNAYDQNIGRTRNYADAMSQQPNAVPQQQAKSNYPTNFSNVVAPNESGVGNTSVKSETEKVSSQNIQSEAPRMISKQNPNTYDGRREVEPLDANLQYQRDVAVGRNIAIGSVMSAFLIGSGVVGASMYHEQQNNEHQEHLQKSLDKANEQNDMDEASHLKVGDKTTIDTRKKDSDKQKLESAEVIDNSHGNIIVKTPDGKKWKLK